MLRKLIVYCISFIVLTLFASPAFAQASTPSSTSKESKPTFEVSQTTIPEVSKLPTTVSPTSPLYTDLLVHNIFHTFSCLAIGQSVIGQPCLTYQMTKNAQGIIQGVPVLSSANLQGGTLGAVTGLIAGLYQNPPVRTYESLASLGENLGFIKEAHAQVIGSGEAVLHPIQTLWQVSRNIAYIIMIIIFVVIGVMVLFRQRINPQTVITAQAAIPGLVIGLILITFSYFLASLISDAAFIGTNLVGAYFSAVRGQANNPQDLITAIHKQNILSIFSPFTKIVGIGDVKRVVDLVWPSLAAPGSNLLPWNFGPQQVLQSLAGVLIAQFILPFGSLFGGIGQVVTGAITFTGALTAPQTMIALAFSFVIMLILIYTMFRLLLRLINSYITIIFLTVTAPFQFLFSSLPGRQGIATDWILNMLANVLAFPAVLAVLYFAAFILGPDVISKNCVDPCPFKLSSSKQIGITGQAAFPLLEGLDLSFVNLLLAFGALVALPAIPDVVQRTISKVSQAGQLIGQEIGAGSGAGQRYAGQFRQGVSGFAGQIGRIPDEPQYYINESGKTIRIDKDAPPSLRSARPGLATRVKSRLGF